MNIKHAFAAAAAACVIGAGGASAAILDFTNPASYVISPANTASGTIDGVAWTITSNIGLITDVETGPGPIAAAPLAGINDGLGIALTGQNDDEITFPREFFTLTFERSVTIVQAFFLDLFLTTDSTGAVTSQELALVSADGGAPAHFAAIANEAVDSVGFGAFATSLTGTVFTFSAGATNDTRGAPDYALAGLELAPIPLPAGALLLGGALLGMGALSRRRKIAA